jgi:quercetin dioxygenase-like cupin family protein
MTATPRLIENSFVHERHEGPAREVGTHPLPDLSRFVEPPVEFIGEVEGVAFRSTTLAKAGDCVGQHSHAYAHATYVGNGRVRLWQDGAWVGDYDRAEPISIPAGSVHIFQALQDDTHLTCVTIVAVAEAAASRGA